jgi:hypothetical protein
MRDKSLGKSKVIHVKVTVEQNGDSYNATYVPPVIPVCDRDVIVRFRIDTPTPDNIVFDSVSIEPAEQTQLTNPVIHDNGKTMELDDKNTVRETFHLTFGYRDKHSANAASKIECRSMGSEYPQIENNPPGVKVELDEGCKIMGSEYPQIENNPPG